MKNHGTFWTCGECRGTGRVWWAKSDEHDLREWECFYCLGGRPIPAALLVRAGVVALFVAIGFAFVWFCAGAPTHDVLEQIRKAQ